MSSHGTNLVQLLSWDIGPTGVFVSVGCEGRSDSLSPEWHTLNRGRAGALPSVCTAGFLPAFQPGAGHLCLVTTHKYTQIHCVMFFILSFNVSVFYTVH